MGLLVVASVFLMESAALGETRIALMDFISEDNSYRSTLAAADFTAALQSQLAGTPGYQWVERPELSKAETELQLAGFGLISRAEALRSGRWVKADWAVFGRLSTNSLAGRTVSLEVVDLLRGEVLAEQSLTLSNQATGPFKFAAADVSAVAAVMRVSLAEASSRIDTTRGKTAVALLFLSQTGVQTKYPELELSFRAALLKQTNSTGFRLVQLRRAAAAVEESELVLSGLAEADPDAWEKVAEVYLWGTYNSETRQRFDNQTHRFVPDLIVRASLNVWDGTGEPHMFPVALTNAGDADAVASKLLEALAPSLRKRSGASAGEGVRRQLSDTLVAEVSKEIQRANSPSLTSPEGRQTWMHVAEIAEAACFFDPANLAAFELWTRMRYSRTVSMNAQNEFAFARRRSQAWARYVEHFGFRSVLPGPPLLGWWETNSVGAEYVRSAWQPFEMFKFAQENQAQWGVPRDVDMRELDEWQQQFSNEFYARLLKVKDDPAFAPILHEFFYDAFRMSGEDFVIRDPRVRQQVLELLWPRMLALKRARPTVELDSTFRHALPFHYRELGKPGAEQILLKQFADARPETEKPKVRKVKLPRIAELDPAEHGDIFDVPALDFSPPAERIALSGVRPFEPSAKSVGAIAFHQDKVWVALGTEENRPAQQSGSSTERELQPLQNQGSHLWSLDLASAWLQRVEGPLSTNFISGLASNGNELWLALLDAGVAAWNPATGELRRFGMAEGVPPGQYAVVATGNRVFALGLSNDVSVFEPGSNEGRPLKMELKGQKSFFGGDARRLGASGDYLLLCNRALWACNLRSNTWSRWDEQLNTAAPAQGLGRITCVAGNRLGGFWVASSSGLHEIHPAAGQVHSQLMPWSIRIDTRATPWIADKQDVRAPSAGFKTQLQKVMEPRRHPGSASASTSPAHNPFAPGRLTSKVSKLAADGEFVWVLTDQGRVSLYHAPSHRWVKAVQLQGSCQDVAAGDGTAVVGVDLGTGVEFHTFSLKSWAATPEDKWLPEQVSAAERAAKLSTLSAHQQAIYHFFWSEFAAAVELLAPEAGSDPSAETLFLLSKANDQFGLNRPDEARRYADQLLDTFPESVFARLLISEKQLTIARERILERLRSGHPDAIATDPASRRLLLQEFIRDYDANGDAALETDELALACELEPDRLPGSPPTDDSSPVEWAQNLFRTLDSNRDGRLDESELSRSMWFREMLRPRRPRDGNSSAHVGAQTTNQQPPRVRQ
jgi:hypothetical protein